MVHRTVLPAIVTFVYLVVVSWLGAHLVDSARKSPRAPRPWAKIVARSLAIGAVVGAAAILLPESWAWFVAVLGVTPFTLRLTWDVWTFRRFLQRLDDIVTTANEGAVEKALSLRKPPAGQRSHQRWSMRILLAAYRAHELGRTERAIAWLSAVDPARLRQEEALATQQYRAAFAIAIGQLDTARRVIAALPERISNRRYAEAFDVLRALLAAIEGDASDERLREAQTRRLAAVGATADSWATVEAHVLAARADTSGVRELLLGIRARGTEHTLARIARHGGPASAIAARMVDAGPYR